MHFKKRFIVSTLGLLLSYTGHAESLCRQMCGKGPTVCPMPLPVAPNVVDLLKKIPLENVANCDAATMDYIHQLLEGHEARLRQYRSCRADPVGHCRRSCGG